MGALAPRDGQGAQCAAMEGPLAADEQEGIVLVDGLAGESRIVVEVGNLADAQFVLHAGEDFVAVPLNEALVGALKTRS